MVSDIMGHPVRSVLSPYLIRQKLNFQIWWNRSIASFSNSEIAVLRL